MVSIGTTTPAHLATLSAASLSLIIVLTLIGLLIVKEIVSELRGPRVQLLNQALSVAIIPLVIAFVVTLPFKILDSLR